jgi:hypothetical protein
MVTGFEAEQLRTQKQMAIAISRLAIAINAMVGSINNIASALSNMTLSEDEITRINKIVDESLEERRKKRK